MSGALWLWDNRISSFRYILLYNNGGGVIVMRRRRIKVGRDPHRALQRRALAQPASQPSRERRHKPEPKGLLSVRVYLSRCICALQLTQLSHSLTHQPSRHPAPIKSIIKSTARAQHIATMSSCQLHIYIPAAAPNNERLILFAPSCLRSLVSLFAQQFALFHFVCRESSQRSSCLHAGISLFVRSQIGAALY